MKYPVISLFPLFNFSILGIGIFFVAYLLSSGKRKNPSVRLMVTIILILLYELFVNTLLQSGFIYQLPFFFKLEFLVSLALYPVTLLLVFSISEKKFSFRYWHLWLFLPFVHECIQSFPHFFTPVEQKRQMIKLFYEHTRPGPVNLFGNPLLFVKRILVPVAFLGYTIMYIRNKRRTNPGKASASLLNYLLWIAIIIFAFRLSAQLLYYVLYSLTQHELIEKILDSSLLTAAILLLCVLLMSELVKTRSLLFQNSSKKKLTLEQHDRNELLVKKVFALLVQEQYYKQDITLRQLAGLLDTNEKYISEAINEKKGISFSDMLNLIRVQKSKELLMAGEGRRMSMEGIAAEVGFQSKSTFYRVFRKKTGMSPTEFAECARLITPDS